MAQAHSPFVHPGGGMPHLPLHPVRVAKINYALFDYIINGLIFSPANAVAVRWIVRTLFARRRHITVDLRPNIQYHPDNPTLRLDVHCKKGPVSASSALRPVVVFVYGGSWASGNKLIYGPLGHSLAEAGYVAVIPNYTLFPHGFVADMLQDVACVVNWTAENIR
ncbi:hypothetical protein HK405_015638, partial [Cladochytrium tenue]